MAELQLTPEDLLAGASVTHDLLVPPQVLRPGANGQEQGKEPQPMMVQLRPLTIGVFQLIMKATRQDPSLVPLLMIKESLVQPALSLEQVKQLHLGLVNFLIAHIREISGLTEKKSLSTS
jgi:hypothetical protein